MPKIHEIPADFPGDTEYFNWRGERNEDAVKDGQSGPEIKKSLKARDAAKDQDLKRRAPTGDYLAG